LERARDTSASRPPESSGKVIGVSSKNLGKKNTCVITLCEKEGVGLGGELSFKRESKRKNQ